MQYAHILLRFIVHYKHLATERKSNMKAFFYTFGCKVNQYETENIKEAMLSEGYEVTEDYADAEVCVVNTCTVTAQSDSKCRQLIHKIKKANPDCLIVLAGCFPQAFEKEASALDECGIIVGTGAKKEIPALIKRYITSGERIIRIVPRERGETFEKMTNSGAYQKTRAYIKIQDGCDQYCTYCIIPTARGHICSKPLEDIAPEVQQLVDSGHKEIILTGINLCCYGRDFKNGTRLIDAVEAACGCDGDYRVRIGSVEPELISDEDILRMSKLEKLCPHFHLSLQSGCDETLKRMNRHYDTVEYAELCEKLRRHFPNCAITTDIMVGFPQETDEEFEKSLAFAKKISFAETHIFPYSRRPTTVADKMKGQLDRKTKHSRAAQMADVCNETKALYLKSLVGTVQEVLFEKETSPQWHQGHAPNYVTVKIPRDSEDVSLRRQLLKIEITSSDGEFCYGKLI